MKLAIVFKIFSLTAFFMFASISVVASDDLPSHTLEEIKQSLIYQGMNEKGYFRSVGFLNSGKMESESTVYVSKFSPEILPINEFVISEFRPSECRTALKSQVSTAESPRSYYDSRPTPKIGFNHVSVIPDGASVEIQNIASALAKISEESVAVLPNLEISAKMRSRSSYENYFLNTSDVYDDPAPFQIISTATLGEKGKGKSKVPLIRFWDVPNYLRGSVEVLGKITLLKDQQFVEAWNWEVSIPSDSVGWSVPALVSKLELVIGSKIVDSLIDVNALVRCSPEIKLVATAQKDKYVLNAGSSSGLSVGDLFVLIPEAKTFRNRGLIAGAELSRIVEVAKLNRTESELIVVDGKENSVDGMTFLAKSMETI